MKGVRRLVRFVPAILVLAQSVTLALLLPREALAQEVEFFHVLTERAEPWGIAVDSEDRVWFVEWTHNNLGLIENGVVSERRACEPTTNPFSNPREIEVDSQDNLWIAWKGRDWTHSVGVSMIDPSTYTFTNYPMWGVNDIAIDSEDNVWVSLLYWNRIARISGGSVTYYEAPWSDYPAGPNQVTVDGQDIPWFSFSNRGVIGRFADGQWTLYSVPQPTEGFARPLDLAFDSTGALWFTGFGNALGRLDVNDGTVTEWCHACNPGGYGLAVDEHDNVWFNPGDLGVLSDGVCKRWDFSGMSPTRRLALDSQGNVWLSYSSHHVVARFTADGTPPTSAIALRGAPGKDGWYVSQVEVTLTAADNEGGSGVAYTEYSLDGGGAWHAYTAPFTIAQEGVTTVLARSADNAGNLEGPPVSAEVRVDFTPPTIVGTGSPLANAYGWNNTGVLVHFDCTDAVSEVAVCPSDTTLYSEGAGQSVSGTAYDVAGNTASVTVGDINIDMTPPIVAITELSPNPANVSETAGLVAEVSDDLSGVQSALWCAESESQPCIWEPMNLSGDPGDSPRTALASISGLLPGVYTISVRGQDLAYNWSEPVEALLATYDPDAGFATGGGWIVPGSQPGDLLPGITGEDKANSGFVVQYKKGATTPDGQVQFHYRVGDFNLHSTEMHWMVINNNWVKFQGYATIGLHPEQLFYFRVDARDGDQTGEGEEDRFILKVWYDFQDPNTDDPLYRASGDLVGGNIIIHTK